MIKKLARLLGNIVRWVKKDMLTTFLIGIGTMMMPVGLFLLTIQLVSDNAPRPLFWVGVIAGVIGFISLLFAFGKAIVDDINAKDNREAQEVIFRNLNHNLSNLNDQLRQDRIERNKKHR